MKKISILIVILSVFLFVGCNKQNKEDNKIQDGIVINVYKNIERQEMEINENNEITNITATPYLKITKEKDIKAIQNAMNNSVIDTRFIEMTPAPYIIEIKNNTDYKIYHLWLGEDSIKALISKQEDINSNYQCNEEDTNNLKEIIFK